MNKKSKLKTYGEWEEEQDEEESNDSMDIDTEDEGMSITDLYRMLKRIQEDLVEESQRNEGLKGKRRRARMGLDRRRRTPRELNI